MQALQLTALAFAANIGFQLVGFMLFSRLGVTDALTVGFVSGIATSPWCGSSSRRAWTG